MTFYIFITKELLLQESEHWLNFKLCRVIRRCHNCDARKPLTTIYRRRGLVLIRLNKILINKYINQSINQRGLGYMYLCVCLLYFHNNIGTSNEKGKGSIIMLPNKIHVLTNHSVMKTGIFSRP